MAAGQAGIKPSQTYDYYWIWQRAPILSADKETLGKWLVFKPVSKIDETWEKIRELVASGELGATGAKVSTMRESPYATSRFDKVICVYTTREDMDEVGLKLIQVVQQTIRYKTNEETRAGNYSWSGKGKVTCRTLTWSHGNPQFTD